MPNHQPNPEALRRLKAAAYYQGAGFGSFSAFFDLVDVERGSIRQDYQVRYPWRAALLTEELARLQNAFEHREFRSALDAFHSPGRPEAIFDEFAGMAAEMFALKKRPSFHLVETIPAPFESRPWDAVSVDSLDAARFGIPARIFFRRRATTHYYLEFVVAHEIAHWTISQFSSNYLPFTAPIEEGVCDIVALELLARSGTSQAALSNLLIYNRALQPGPPWGIYWQATRNVASFVLADGLNTLTDVMRHGRHAVNALAGGAVTHRRSTAVPASVAAVMNASAVMPLGVDALLAASAAISARIGGIVGVAELRDATRMPTEALNVALGELETSGWITRVGKAELFVPHESIPPYIRYIL